MQSSLPNLATVFLNQPVPFLFKSSEPKQLATTSSIQVGDKRIPLLFIHSPRSKRYILRLRPDGTARVTIPRRGSLKVAQQFAEKNVAWLRGHSPRADAHEADESLTEILA